MRLRQPFSDAGIAVLLLALAIPASARGQSTAAAARNYWVYVGAESADLIHRIRFGPGGAVVERTIPVGEQAAEMEGPHGLQISADGRFLHMTTGHGIPDGKYWKLELGPDTLVGEPIPLGFFPASIDVTPDGLYAFVANFNLHGEMLPSSISVVYTPSNMEVARTTTCTMPHGSRIDRTGLRQYSTCMMDDQLVEIDTRDFSVARRFSLAKQAERALAASDSGKAAEHAAMGHRMPAATCSPTWAQPSVDGTRVFVACNKADEILEIDTGRWTVARRFKTGRGPYNLAVSGDGRLLVATLKQGGATEVFDLPAGKSLATLQSSAPVTHGVVISPDSRFAFVSSEGIGGAPGKVDVIDLRSLTRVASVDVGQQAGGIAFWKTEPAAGSADGKTH